MVGSGQVPQVWFEVECKLAAVVECGEFGLRCQGHDVFDDGRQCESGAIVEVFVIAIQ